MKSPFANDQRLLRLTTASVGAALWGSLLLGFYALVHCPLQHHELTQQAQIADLRVLLQNGSNVHTMHRKLREIERDLKSQIANVRERIPNEPLEATFLSDATAIARQQDLQIENFRRQSIESFPDYSEVDVVISGRGSYASICRFLLQVSELERLSTVRTLDLRGSDAQQRYPFEVVYSLQFGMQTKLDTLAQGGQP